MGYSFHGKSFPFKSIIWTGSLYRTFENDMPGKYLTSKNGNFVSPFLFSNFLFEMPD